MLKTLIKSTVIIISLISMQGVFARLPLEECPKQIRLLKDRSSEGGLRVIIVVGTIYLPSNTNCTATGKCHWSDHANRPPDSLLREEYYATLSDPETCSYSVDDPDRQGSNQWTGMITMHWVP